MTTNPRFIFIGNFLSAKTGTRSVCEDLAERLADRYCIVTTSSKTGRISRAFNMIWTIWHRRNDYDLAYLEVFSGKAFIWAEICGSLLSLLRKPFILSLHGGGLPNFAKKHPYRVQRLLYRANRVVTPSHFIKKSLESLVPGIEVIPNAIDTSNYSFRLRRKVQPSMIWLRAFHAIYNPEMAVQTLALLLMTESDAVLTMIGPDKRNGSLEQVQQLVRRLDIEKKLTMPGAVSKTNLPLELNKGDIFINTTRFESFGISVMEAAACGLCIVTTNVGELAYLWEDGIDALVVPPDDPDAMAAAVIRILTEPGLAEKLSINARKKAEKYDWSSILPSWEELFHKVYGGYQN